MKRMQSRLMGLLAGLSLLYAGQGWASVGPGETNPQVVMQAVEFYVNSEKAVMELRSLINNAKERNRIDLVERYISMLSTLTENTSYEGI